MSPIIHRDFKNLNKIKSLKNKRSFFSPDPNNYKKRILNLKNIKLMLTKCIFHSSFP